MPVVHDERNLKFYIKPNRKKFSEDKKSFCFICGILHGDLKISFTQYEALDKGNRINQDQKKMFTLVQLWEKFSEKYQCWPLARKNSESVF